jgi:RNA polymerase sigma-70 factor (ECF subfamily)
MDQYRQGIHYNWQMANTRALGQESDAQEAMLGRDFEDIVAENESKIFNTIYSFTGNYEDALDLTQEAFISAYRHIDKFRQESSIYTWLYRIAINLCKKHYNRKKKRDSVFTSSLDDPETLQHVGKRVSEYRSATEILELDEEQSMIRREIACLPEKHRVVIILKYMQDLSYEEVADVLGCGVGTVKSRLSRAKEKLKQRLERAVEVGHDGL